MENGSAQIIKTEMGMLELGNELRSKSKVSVNDLDGEPVTIKSADVHSIEDYRQSNKS